MSKQVFEVGKFYAITIGECHTPTSDIWHYIMDYAVQVKKPDIWDAVELAQGKGE